MNWFIKNLYISKKLASIALALFGGIFLLLGAGYTGLLIVFGLNQVLGFASQVFELALLLVLLLLATSTYICYKILKQVYHQEEQINQRILQLQGALKAKNEFLRIANHQLNTPLSIMNNAYAMVKDKSLTQKQGIEYWGSGLKRLAQVAEDFLDVFQLEGGVRYTIAKNDIEVAIKEAVEYKKKALLISKKSIAIEIKESGFPVPRVMCDIKKVTNAIYNLLDNAIFYTHEGSVVVSYELVDSGRWLKVNIKDTGIGFSPEEKVKIGQEFYRTKKALLVHPNGSGLGLYICKNIIEGNKGKFIFDSEGEGKGSTFSFTLPIAASST